jgi:hypothetical protein
MDIKRQFEYEPIIEVSASQIGISKWNWITTSSINQNEAIKKMRDNRFDVLPIKNQDGSVTSYFVTQEWNDYSNLNKINIGDAHTVYYKLSFRDLLRKFKNEERHYYFLTDYQDILGLVSFVNLNCQIVYNYLFFIISDLERSVSECLKSYVSQEKIIEYFSKSNDNHLSEILSNFNNSMHSNYDNDIFQLMYLQTIGITLKKFLNDLPDKYKKLGKYSAKFGSEGVYNLIRNKVMHPVRPILSDQNSIMQINELLDDYIMIKEILGERD